MGTNYYLRKTCKECGHAIEEYHLGKSSGGWCFSLHVIPEDRILDLDDWIYFIEQHPEMQIYDEYDTKLTLEEFLSVVRDREWVDRPSLKDQVFLDQNQAEPGPNNLLRHRLSPEAIRDLQPREHTDGTWQPRRYGCISQGAGTWDCLTGEFC